MSRGQSTQLKEHGMRLGSAGEARYHCWGGQEEGWDHCRNIFLCEHMGSQVAGNLLLWLQVAEYLLHGTWPPGHLVHGIQVVGCFLHVLLGSRATLA